MEALILAENLHKKFGHTEAVRGISFQVAPGEIYGLVGPDSAGKTTIIRILCGAIRPTSGKALIAGYPLSSAAESARAQIGYLSQRFSLYEELTVMENIRFFAEVRGVTASQWLPRCQEILHFVGLAEFGQRRAGQLSGGMKQKLGLASALVHRPRILLLDEPTTGVDPVTRQDFWQLIIRLAAQESIAVAITTPYMDEASRCHRVGFLRKGQLVAEGKPADLKQQLNDRILEVSGRPLALIRQIAQGDPDVENVQLFGDRIHVQTAEGKGAEVTRRLKSQARQGEGIIDHIAPIPAQLEDVFIALSGEGA